MKQALVIVVTVFAAFVVGGIPASAVDTAVVTGGGTGTFGADIDGDGRMDGSQFGFGVVLSSSGAARGHFECLMAGRSQILGLPVMSVEGRVTGGTMNADGTVTLSGTATVNLGNGQIFRSVPFEVVITAGGPGTGGLKLTVVGTFDGVPGDAVAGNGNYDLPQESVASGHITIATS